MAEQPSFRDHPGEPRLPAAVAVVVAIALYALLPGGLLLGPRFVVPALEALLFIPLVVANPTRMTRQNQVLRRLSIGLVLVIAAANAVALILLVDALVGGGTAGGKQLLLAAGQVWATNILVFA
jgi:hypothetical protein